MSQRKARSTIGLYAPNLLGYTWTTMAWTIGCDAVRCPVKSGNERDLRLQLLTAACGTEHIAGTALETGRKVQATVGLYAPNPLGNTRATMVRTLGCNSERRSQASKPHLSPN